MIRNFLLYSNKPKKKKSTYQFFFWVSRPLGPKKTQKLIHINKTTFLGNTIMLPWYTTFFLQKVVLNEKWMGILFIQKMNEKKNPLKKSICFPWSFATKFSFKSCFIHKSWPTKKIHLSIKFFLGRTLDSNNHQ